MSRRTSSTMAVAGGQYLRHCHDGKNLIMRLATIDDHHGIVDIDRNVYYGYDYLHRLYPHMMSVQSIKTLSCVCQDEDNGKIVSFGFAHVVDGGKTIFSRGGRTHQDYRKYRISSTLLHQFFFPFVTSKFPNATRHRYSAVSDNPTFTSFKSTSQKVLMRRPYKLFTGNPTLLKNISQDGQEEANLLTSEQTIKLLTTTSELSRNLFDGDVAFVDQVAFETKPENCAVVSDLLQPFAVFSDLKHFASFGHLHAMLHTPQVAMYCLDIYKHGESGKSLGKYILQHMHKLGKDDPSVTTANILLMHDPLTDFEQQVFFNFLEENGFKNEPSFNMPGQPTGDHILFEGATSYPSNL